MTTSHSDQQVVSQAEQRVLSLTGEFALAWKRTLSLAVELGVALEELKRERGYGHFLPWVEEHFVLGIRMAQRFMDLAANASEMSHLPPETPLTAALAWLQAQRREPKPLKDSTDEAREGPVTRYLIDVETADVVADILRVCFPQAETALDVTYGNGAFWNGERTVEVTAHDLDPARALHGEMDFRDLKYGDQSFDVVLFDPPHMADTGEDSVLGQRFSSYANDDLRAVVDKGVQEAWRVSGQGIVVKVADTVHNQVFVRMSMWVEEVLIPEEPYEVIHQVRTKPFVDPKWLKPQLSAINNGSIYMVYRRGSQKHARTK